MNAEVTSPDGWRPVIAVGEHELVSSVMTQAERTGGCANLFVLMDDDSLVSAGILPAASAIVENRADSLDSSVHEDAEVGLLVRSAESAPHGLNFQVSLPTHEGTVENAKPLALAG